MEPLVTGPSDATPLDRIQLAERISDWIDRLDLDDDAARTAFATGLASALAAADEARRRLEALLRTAPLDDAAEADRALEELTELHLQLTSELPEQIAEMGDAWTAIEDRLIELGPDE
jgi:phytoene dehydrogenase-like protein